MNRTQRHTVSDISSNKRLFIFSPTQRLLSYGNSEVTQHSIVLCVEASLKSQCYDDTGLRA